MLLPVAPQVFDRVQLGRVGGQVLGLDVALRVAEELLHQSAAMRRQAIPHDEQRTLHVAHQRLEEVDHLGTADGVGIETEVEVVERDSGRRRELLPVEVELQYGRLPTRRPRAATMWLQAQSAFVDEDDRAPLFLGFFLMVGQVFFFHVRIASSLRSRALPTGLCGLQFSARSSFQT